VERYYWNFTALYGYYPENYVRSYVDTDGTQNLEKYSYARNLYRGDLNLKPFKNATIQLHGRYEQYYYNQYFTEYDANATTLGLGARYAFPAFSLGANYRYRVYDNHRHDAEDGSYASNRYSGNIRLKSTPLNNDKPDSPTFYPELTLSYEERFFQSLDPWYGGRADFIYNTSAAFNFDFGPSWNLKLDYSHAYRNVESPVEEVCRAREYSENKVSATVKYRFSVSTMEFRKESDVKKIRELLDLSENHKIELRHYKNPVLVWAVADGTAYYTIWENELLERYGLANVDGWDFEEDLLFCPDWMEDDNEDDDDLDDDDDEDLGLICDFKLPPPEKK
jgi:hypothetical protein